MKHVNAIKDKVIGAPASSTPEARFGTYNQGVADAIRKNKDDPDALLELAGELTQYGSTGGDLAKSVFTGRSSG